MQIKTTMRYHLILDRLSAIKKTRDNELTNPGEDVEQREPWYTIGGNVNWYDYYGNQYGGYSKN